VVLDAKIEKEAKIIRVNRTKLSTKEKKLWKLCKYNIVLSLRIVFGVKNHGLYIIHKTHN